MSFERVNVSRYAYMALKGLEHRTNPRRQPELCSFFEDLARRFESGFVRPREARPPRG